MDEIFKDVLDFLKEYGLRKGLEVTEVSVQRYSFMSEFRIQVALRDPKAVTEALAQGQQQAKP